MGYIKRTPLYEYRTQKRGGIGAKGSSTREEDFLEHVFVATMHNYLLFFTDKGRCYWMKVYEIPEGAKVSKGRAIQNMINIEPGDKIRTFIPVKNLSDQEFIRSNYIVLCTEKGIIKKTLIEAYSRPRQNGINAISIREGDKLIEAKLTNGLTEIVIAVHSGRAIRFPESKVRPMGRNALGVKGITLKDEKEDSVVGMICVYNASEDVLVVSENGYGKRSKIADYRITNRGGKGVKTMNINKKTGKLVKIKGILDTDDLLVITKSGTTIRLPVSNIRITGRTTQGVRLINLRDKETVAAVAIAEENIKQTQDAETQADNQINDTKE